MNLRTLVICILICTVLISPLRVSAALGIPFGGKITYMRKCISSSKFYVLVVHPAGMVYPLIYSPVSTRLYAKYKPISGSNVLGVFRPTGNCDGFPAIGTIIFMGTS